MKMLRTVAALAVAAALCAGFTSCSKDEEDAPGKAEITIGGAKLDTNYAYYTINEEGGDSEGMSELALYFFNYNMLDFWQSQDYSKMPETFSMVGIDFQVPESQTGVHQVTVPRGEYHVYVVRDMPLGGDSNGWQGENDQFQSNLDSPLVIKKDGDKYTVSFSAVIHGHNGVIQEMKFDFSGPITQAPEHLFD